MKKLILISFLVLSCSACPRVTLDSEETYDQGKRNGIREARAMALEEGFMAGRVISKQEIEAACNEHVNDLLSKGFTLIDPEGVPVTRYRR